VDVNLKGDSMADEYNEDEYTPPSQMSDEDLVEYITQRQKYARDASDDWRNNAEECYNFVAGHQWDDTEQSKLTGEDRPVITFNRVNVHISAILGMEANQRQETTFYPRGNEDTALTEAISEITAWGRDYAEINTEEAASFEDMITGGMGWSETRMCYETDLDGKIIQETVDPFEMYWDPEATKRNLTDAKDLTRAKRMAPHEIKDQWPDADVSFEMAGDMAVDEDQQLVWSNPVDRYGENEQGDTKNKTKQLVVLQHQWYESVCVYRVMNLESGEMLEISEEKFKERKEQIEAAGIKYIKQRKRKYFQAFIAGTELLEKSPCSSQEGFTFKCITGKRDKIQREWYGLVRLMIDPARWSNKFFSLIIDIMASNSKGGLIVEENTFVDATKAEDEWSSPDSITVVRSGAISGRKIQEKPVAQYPAGIDRMMQFAISSLREVTGLNLEVLGMADRQQANVLEESRKKSAYTILAPFFDSLTSYRKQSGMLYLEFIKEYLPVRRMEEVLEGESKQYAQQIKKIDLKAMNLVVSESGQSDNNKALTWAFVTQVLPGLLQMGLPVPPDILEYTPLPAALTEKWKKMIEQQAAQKAKPNPMQEKAMQLEMATKAKELEKLVAETQKILSEAKLKTAQTEETEIDADLKEAKGPDEAKKQTD